MDFGLSLSNLGGMRNLFFYLVLVYFLGFGRDMYAQHELVDVLVAEGLQNVQIAVLDHELVLGYENNRYRYEAEALGFVIDAVGHHYDGPDELLVSVLIRHKGIPMSSVTSSLGALRALVKRNLDYASWSDQARFGWEVSRLDQVLKEAVLENKSYRKVDLPVGVQLDYQLGNFDNAVRIKFNVQPEVTSVLTKGLTASAMYTMSTWNDLNNSNGSRLVIARLSQDIRLGNHFFMNLTGGAFTRNRLGIVANAQYYLTDSEQWRLQASWAETDYGFFDSKLSLIQVPENYRMYHAGITYRNRQFHTDVDVRYGRFLFGDEGYKLNVTRQIDEVFIGFFINKATTGAKNVGFEFQVPVGFKKHLKPMAVRPMTREFFYLPYYYSGTGVGLNFYAGENALLNIKEYYPSTLKRGLEKYLVRD